VSVTVLGGNGFLGLSIVPALMEAGIVPACGRRKRSNVLGLRALKVPLVLADLDLPETLEQALGGCETVVHVAGHYPRLSVDREGTLALAVRQTRALLDAVAAAGARRMVYVSSTATVAPRPDGPSTEADRYPAAPGFGTYHDVKWHLEALVEAETRFETVTVCPGACLGPHDYRLGTAAFLAATARGLQPAHPEGLVNVVDVRDVGHAVARVVVMRTPPRRVLLAAEVHSLHGLLQLVAPRYGAPPPVPALGAAEAVALADAQEQLAHQTKQRPTLSRELVDLVVHGVPVDARLSRKALGLSYRPLAQTLDAFDDWARRVGLLAASPPVAPSPHPPSSEKNP
jgi:dihydroflavonol-4-reductase